MLQPTSELTSSPKQIAIVSSTPSAILYTVSSGRKFIGKIVNTISPFTILINGVVLSFANNGISAATEITLVAGTVVSNNSGSAGNSHVLGIEVDA